MPTYKAPLDDFRFVLEHVVGLDRLAALPRYADLTPDVVDAVLAEAARLCEEVFFPLNQVGDTEGCRLEDGRVRTPTGFPDAYRTFVEGGWPSLTIPPEHGGQGMPHAVTVGFEEMMSASNQSFSMYPGLTQGAANLLATFGSDELKERFLPPMVEGRWSGTMCLTEAHAGTDLGMIRTRAVPTGDGAYAVTGTKIFISAGDHDLTENIVHLVLAKLPDAPPGTRGISLLVVPKFLPTEEGKPGRRNAVAVGSIEHKMGIKGNATCVLNFDGATGWLLGEPHQGMREMFVLMNGARLATGLQGLGIAEVSYQNAVAYARERLQGRSLAGVQNPAGPADPIIAHPDVRRGLMRMRALVEGSRALAFFVGAMLDDEAHHPDVARREEAADLVDLLTPVVKAFLSDMGFECANIGLQTYGGHGYIREFGMEQYVRDVRIAQIYEGTNGVQALDLVGRKLPMHDGRLVKRFFARVERALAEGDGEATAPLAAELKEAADALGRTTMGLARRAAKAPVEAGAAASEYLRLFGLVSLGYMWLIMARAAARGLAGGTADAAARAQHEAKLATARFFFARVLPEMRAAVAIIEAGAAPVMALPADAF